MKTLPWVRWITEFVLCYLVWTGLAWQAGALGLLLIINQELIFLAIGSMALKQQTTDAAQAIRLDTLDARMEQRVVEISRISKDG